MARASPTAVPPPAVPSISVVPSSPPAAPRPVGIPLCDRVHDEPLRPDLVPLVDDHRGFTAIEITRFGRHSLRVSVQSNLPDGARIWLAAYRGFIVNGELRLFGVFYPSEPAALEGGTVTIEVAWEDSEWYAAKMAWTDAKALDPLILELASDPAALYNREAEEALSHLRLAGGVDRNGQPQNHPVFAWCIPDVV
ncbi:MAG: hypothetical protein AAGN82_16400 [Myxococcota bacterium]